MLSFTSCKRTRSAEASCRPLLSRRLISLSVTSVFLFGGIVGGVVMGSGKSAEAKAGQADKSTEGQRLLDELDEIDLMRSLGPLKLTPEEIDQIIPVIEKAKADYDKNINDLNANTIGQIASDIHAEHKDALSGNPIPKAFDDKVKEKLESFFKRRDAVNAQNIEHISGAFQKILTDNQQKIAVRLERQTYTQMGKKISDKDTDDQFFNLYVTDIFIGYPRIVPLLKEIKASK